MARHEKSNNGHSDSVDGAVPVVAGEGREVLQVEKHDYTELRPNDKPRAHSLEGFDPIYTDIVDYIIRCTHRIWDEKNVGLIYTHYTHNAVVFTPLGSSYSREEVVRGTLQRIAEFPERRGLGHQVIWNGNDVDGFYTSHLVTSVGRSSTAGPYGAPTGKMFYSRTFADCMVFRNRIFREWIVRDNIAQLLQFGIDPDIVATKMARRTGRARGSPRRSSATRPGCSGRSIRRSGSTPRSRAPGRKRNCCRACIGYGTSGCSAICAISTRRMLSGTDRGCRMCTGSPR